MPTPIERLASLLDVESIEVDLYRGQNTDALSPRVYGGQVVAQALAAAQRTVAADRPVHSLHSYFIRPGEPKVPILYRIARERDGTSFTTRHVTAIQRGQPIFTLSASFQRREAGLSHQISMPEFEGPEGLESEAELFVRHQDRIPEPWRTMWGGRERPFEFRPVSHSDPFSQRSLPPKQQYWFKADGNVPADPAIRAALFAYATDMTLLDTSLLPHAVPWHDPKLQAASLDHSIWFHEVPDPSEWLLSDQQSPISGGGRGLNIAHVYNQKGQMVATVVQEGLIRYRS